MFNLFYFSTKNQTVHLDKFAELLYNSGMRVYRYLSREELLNIRHNRVFLIGTRFETQNNGKNTHKYNSYHKYLHFYKSVNGMQEIRTLYREYSQDFYFCAFEIPTHILLSHRGKGFYPPHGYDEPVSTEIEYAIPVEEFKPDWLSSYVLDSTKKLVLTKEKYISISTKLENNVCEEPER